MSWYSTVSVVVKLKDACRADVRQYVKEHRNEGTGFHRYFRYLKIDRAGWFTWDAAEQGGNWDWDNLEQLIKWLAAYVEAGDVILHSEEDVCTILLYEFDRRSRFRCFTLKASGPWVRAAAELFTPKNGSPKTIREKTKCLQRRMVTKELIDIELDALIKDECTAELKEYLRQHRNDPKGFHRHLKYLVTDSWGTGDGDCYLRWDAGETNVKWTWRQLEDFAKWLATYAAAGHNVILYTAPARDMAVWVFDGRGRMRYFTMKPTGGWVSAAANSHNRRAARSPKARGQEKE